MIGYPSKYESVSIKSSDWHQKTFPLPAIMVRPDPMTVVN